MSDLTIDGLADLVEVGSGGFATVYQGTDEAFTRRVAVKVLHSLNAAGRRRFDRELSLMGRLDEHPNVITPYRFGYTNAGSPYLVMEYAAHGSLQDLVDRSGALDWHRAAAYVAPVADALGHAHRHGILHRDVKPANILIVANGAPKLSDFGISSIREGTATAHVAYTLAHSPPETFTGGHDSRDERSDLYSLASTLFTLLAGRPPFSVTGPDSQAALMQRILSHPVPSLDRGGPIDRFLAFGMAKDPNHRPATASQFVSALSGTLPDAAVAVAPPTHTGSPVAPVALVAPVNTTTTTGDRAARGDSVDPPRPPGLGPTGPAEDGDARQRLLALAVTVGVVLVGLVVALLVVPGLIGDRSEVTDEASALVDPGADQEVAERIVIQNDDLGPAWASFDSRPRSDSVAAYAQHAACESVLPLVEGEGETAIAGRDVNFVNGNTAFSATVTFYETEALAIDRGPAILVDLDYQRCLRTLIEESITDTNGPLTVAIETSQLPVPDHGQRTEAIQHVARFEVPSLGQKVFFTDEYSVQIGRAVLVFQWSTDQSDPAAELEMFELLATRFESEMGRLD